MTVFAKIGDHAAPHKPGFAPCTRSGRAGSANDAHPAGIRGGTTFKSLSSTARTVLPGREARCGSRLGRCGCRRRWWVRPKAVLSTTLAVLRPTPGSASSASRAPRHRARVPLQQCLAGGDDVLRLAVVEPDRPDVGRQSCDAQGQYRAAGVLAAAKQRRPSPCSRSCRWPAPRESRRSAVRTACRYSSSVRGAGLRSRSRSKISAASARSWRIITRRPPPVVAAQPSALRAAAGAPLPGGSSAGCAPRSARD